VAAALRIPLARFLSAADSRAFGMRQLPHRPPALPPHLWPQHRAALGSLLLRQVGSNGWTLCASGNAGSAFAHGGTQIRIRQQDWGGLSRGQNDDPPPTSVVQLIARDCVQQRGHVSLEVMAIRADALRTKDWHRADLACRDSLDVRPFRIGSSDSQSSRERRRCAVGRGAPASGRRSEIDGVVTPFIALGRPGMGPKERQ